MSIFYIDASIGSFTLVKVEAPDLDSAMAAVQWKVAEDFNEAGTVKPYDVNTRDVTHELGKKGTDAFDESIVVTGPGPSDYKVASDDPAYYEEEEG